MYILNQIFKNKTKFNIVLVLSIIGFMLANFNNAQASEDSYDFGGYQCNSSGTKNCINAYPTRQGGHQMWKGRVNFTYDTQGTGDVREDVCISRNSSMWDSDDLCWLIMEQRGFDSMGSKTITRTHDLSENMQKYLLDYDYFVINISIDSADTSTTGTVWTRAVSTDELNTGGTNFSTSTSTKNVPISWATNSATLGAELYITGGGTPISKIVVYPNTDANQNKSGIYDASFKRRGSKTITLNASGPLINGSSPPMGIDETGQVPPFEVFVPRVAKLAYAEGDGGSDSRTRNINILGGAIKVNSNLSTTFGFSDAVNFSGCPTMSVNAGQTWGCGLNLDGDHDIPATSAGKNYTISPAAKSGYTVSVSSSDTQKVNDNQITTFTISYTPIVQYGTVKVTSNVNNTTFGFGGTGAFGGCPAMTDLDIGETWTCTTVDPGTHTINPQNKTSEGYNDPPVVKNAAGQSGKEMQTLSAGGTIEYNISYTAATGTISVTSNKRTDWNINGPGSNDFSATNDDVQNYTGVPLGDYTISGVPATIIADSGKWWSLDSITPSTTQTLSSSGQTKTFTIDYQQSQPVCSPGTQSKQVGSSAGFTATGGDGSFSWSAPGGSPSSSGSGSSFSTTYSTTGSKTVTVTSNQGQTDTCSVTVTIASACTADIKANSSDGPVSIDYDTAANLTWGSVGASSCSVAPGGWTGTSSVGQSTGNLTSSQAYTLSCTGPGDPCSNAVTVNVGAAPTLSAGLTANPSTGTAPLSSTLSATVGGTATGTINYSFWWNCSDAGTSVAAVSGVCGALTAPISGSCVETAGVGYKCDGISAASQNTVAHSYNSTSTGKVIVERDGAASAEARTSITISSLPPSASGVTVTPPNYCVSGPAATVGWTYSDPLGSPQSAYRVQIDNNASFVSPELDTNKVISSSGAYFSGTGILALNTNYNVRVMVWNSSDAPSAWSSTVGFSTPNYAYPQVDFSFSPTNPAISAPVQFTDSTIFYAPGPKTWSWLFGDAGNSTLQNPTHTYTTQGSYGATLTATDNAGNSCSLTQPVNIQPPIPIWKEVAPR